MRHRSLIALVALLCAVANAQVLDNVSDNTSMADKDYSLEKSGRVGETPQPYDLERSDGADIDFGDNEIVSEEDESLGLNIKEDDTDATPKIVTGEPDTGGDDGDVVQTFGAASLPNEPQPDTTVEDDQIGNASVSEDVLDASVRDTGPEAAQVIPTNEFGGTPYIPGTRRNIASGEAPERYKVEEGDTLYDICDQLIDEPDYWPKLWALNPGIKNPHFIFPGMVLQFYPGDSSTPPFLQVVTEEDLIPIETDGVDESELVAINSTELLLENNKPVAIEVFDQSEMSLDQGIEAGFEVFGKAYEASSNQIIVPAFFFEEEVEPLGEVVAGPTGRLLARPGNRVVIEKEEDIQIGMQYLIVRASGEIESEASGDDVGYRYEYIARVQIVDQPEDEDYVIGKITDGRLGVNNEDLLVNYASYRREYDIGDARVNAENSEVSVVGFEHPNQVMGGQGNLVYLDGQLPSGSIMPVYQRVDGRISSEFPHDIPEVVGKVGIVRIIDQIGPTSLGVIEKNSYDIRVGDKLGKG